MNKIKSRLNKVGERLLEQAADIQYLANLGFFGTEVLSPPGWNEPVRLPPREEIGLFGSGDAESKRPQDLSDSQGRRRTPVLLATHFLRKWFEWRSLSSRLARFFGVDGRDSLLIRPNPGRVDGVEILAERLAANEGFLSAYRDKLLPRPLSQQEVGAEDLVMSFTQLGEHDRLLRGLIQYSQERGADSEVVWSSLKDLTGMADRILNRLSTSNSQSETVGRQLRAYRYSTLSLSWLLEAEESEGEEDQVGSPIIDQVYDGLDGAGVARAEVSRYLRSKSGKRSEHQGYWRLANSVLPRLFQTVSEIGLKRSIETITDEDFQGGSDTPLRTKSHFVITPKQEADPDEMDDASVCIALAIRDEFHPGLQIDNGGVQSGSEANEEWEESSRKQRISDFERVVERVKLWLARYGREEQIVLMITDLRRDSGRLKIQNRAIFQAWHDRGVGIFVAVPDVDGTELSLVSTGLE
ncbi:hypothetical protein GGQ13_002980 [Salinibacter ruber]|uniref:hypothetical protein n=1 Tax=Salinibacter ruber TaxID=146919 RepID=UPI00216A9330|nr:hypothetical protein [Salinibacter ruber]MCS4139525.1 hypothetical protein [Salinibacter ruber]